MRFEFLSRIQTDLPCAASSPGTNPTPMVDSTLRAEVDSRKTMRLPALVTHTDPPAPATRVGTASSGMSVTAFPVRALENENGVRAGDDRVGVRLTSVGHQRDRDCGRQRRDNSCGDEGARAASATATSSLNGTVSARKRCVVVEDARLELLQLRAGLEAEVVAQDSARVLVGVERGGRSTCLVQREHQLSA